MAARRGTSRKSSGGGAKAIPTDARLCVLHGKEAYLRTLHLDRLRDALREAGTEPDVIRFSGREADVADVLDECRSFGLMVSYKVVVVDDADQFVKGEDRRALLERYAQDPPESAVLVLRAETWNKGKLDKLIERHGVIIKCDAPTPGQATRWAVDRATRRHGRTLSPDAAEMLVERVGADLGRLDSELAKLAAAADGETITAELARELVGMTREQTAWVLQEAVLTGDPETALRTLRELVEVSRAPTVLLRFALADLARKIEQSARWHAGGRTGTRPRLWPQSVAQAVGGLSERLGPRRSGELLIAALEADRKGKSGAGDEIVALEALTVRFASLAGDPADTTFA